MEPLKTLQALSFAVKTLSEIEGVSIDDELKEKLVDKGFQVIGIEKSKRKKRVLGSQEKLLQSLERLGGSVTRSQIASDSGLDPNAVSSVVLQKLSEDKRSSSRGLDYATTPKI